MVNIMRGFVVNRPLISAITVFAQERLAMAASTIGALP
jgi:hypothetical protein